MDKPKIELKKIKEFVGNEGHGLNAEVWVDGVKTCFVVDDASGSIFYDFTVYNKEKYKLLEDYVASVPPHVLEIEGTIYYEEDNVTPKMCDYSMEQLIDEAFTEVQQAKLNKKLEKLMLTKLLFTKDSPGKVNRYFEVGWKNKVTIAQVLAYPTGPAVIKEAIDKEKEKGFRLINTNIPEDLLK